MDEAELVKLAQNGDRAAFASLYDRYADRIYGFCWTLVRNDDDAADLTQDTFLRAAERLHQLRDTSKVRSWLFAIARHECYRRTRTARRIDSTKEVTDMPSVDSDPEALAIGSDIRDVIQGAADGLAPRDRALLELHLREDLDASELGAVMGVSAAHARVLLSRLRDQLERSLGALLVARTRRRDCPELASLLSDWDGQLSPLMRKRVARHIDECEECAQARRRLVSPAALLSAIPAMAAPANLREEVLGKVEHIASLRTRNGWQRDGFPPGEQPRRAVLLAAVAAVVLLVAAVGGLVWWGGPGAGSDSETAVKDSATKESAVTDQLFTDSASVDESTDQTGQVDLSDLAESTTTTNATTPISAGEPGQLVLVERVVDLGAEPHGTTRIANDGGAAITWHVGSDSPWLAVSPASGVLEPGAEAVLAVDAASDTTGAAEGTSRVASLTVDAGEAGAAAVTVNSTVTHAPVIGARRVDPSTVAARRCRGQTHTTISARVTDESAVTVTLGHRLPDGTSGLTAMTPAGGGFYEADLGPFTAGPVVFWVEAVDTYGAASTSPEQDLIVVTC